MNKKSTISAAQKYHTYRHHAWAGTGLLSIFLALRLLFPQYQDSLNPVILGIILYIFIALLFTYRYYREGLAQSSKNEESIISSQKKEDIDEKLEKTRAKLEKKRLTAELKAQKKSKDS